MHPSIHPSLYPFIHSFQGDQFVFHEEWGEQLVGKSHPVLCVLDIESGVASTLDNIPEDVSPGQVGVQVLMTVTSEKPCLSAC